MRITNSWRFASDKTTANLIGERLVARLALAMFTLLPSVASAQIQLDRFYPPVIQIGGETVINAEGKFPTWPVEIVSDRDDVKIVVGKDSGQLTVNVSTDVSPGVVWIRMFDNASASKLVPLLIEPIAATSEVEPNNKIVEATPVELPAVVYGKLAKANDLDTYRIQLKRGQTFVASAVAHRPLRSPMDAVMQLVDGRGNVIFQADDDRGLDPQLVYEADADAELFLRIFAFPEVANSTIGYAGAESFIYAIRLTTDAFVDHALPLVVSAAHSGIATVPYGWNLPLKLDVLRRGATAHSPIVSHVPSALGWQWQTVILDDAVMIADDESGSVAVAESLPCIFSGHIAARGEIDRLRFPVSASTRYEAVVHSRAYGFPLDSVLRVVNVADGSEVASNDDVARGQYDASVTFTPKVAGEFMLEVSDLVDGHGPRHAYSVVIAEATPAADLSIAEDHFIVNAGATVEVPISIVRRNGFDQKLTIIAQGLPEGVVAEPVVSQTKGDTSKTVKLKIVADKAAAFQGNFRIDATSTATDKASSVGDFTAKYRLNEVIAIDDLWLTVVATKIP
jgi:hypothetical protein